MYKFLKNISYKTSCNSTGACSVDPTVSAMEELFHSQIREVGYYVIKLRELGQINKDIEERLIKGLSIIMINTSFDKSDFMKFIHALCRDKEQARERYMQHCRDNHLSCELIDFNNNCDKNSSINSMIKAGETQIQYKYRGVPKEKQRLFELITVFAKTTSITLELLKKIQKDTSYYDFEIIRFFSLTNSLSTRSEKLKRRILEFSKVAFKLQTETNTAYENRWGKREFAKVLLTPKEGKSILVSGPDIFELEALLETIGERKINVYTNSTMFLAHTYPKFKEYKNIIGHLGGNDTQVDFANFPGPILITQNFTQKIDTLLRGTMYSNKLIAPSRVFKIKNNDYEPVIQSALNLEGFDSSNTPNLEKYIEITHSFDKINETLDTLENKNVVIVVGENSVNQDIQDFDGKKVINLESPIESDLLLYTLEKCSQLNIKADLFFTSCSISAVNILMSTLFMGLHNIYLTECSSALINPHVLEALEEDFNVTIIH